MSQTKDNVHHIRERQVPINNESTNSSDDGGNGMNSLIKRVEKLEDNTGVIVKELTHLNARADDFASKGDLRELKAQITGDMKELRAQMTGDMRELKAQISGELKESRSAAREDLAKGLHKQMIWLCSALFTTAGVIIALAKGLL